MEGMQVGMPPGAGDRRMGMLSGHRFAFCGAALALEISSGKCQSEAGNSLTQLVLFGESRQVCSRLLQTEGDCVTAAGSAGRTEPAGMVGCINGVLHTGKTP